MVRKKIFFGIAAVVLVSLALMAFVPISQSPSEKTRKAMALRVIGDRLLRQDGDYESRVLPVLETAQHEFEVAFEKPLAFVPDSLVALFKSQAEKKAIPATFSVEVKDELSGLTVYSFEMPSDEIPCLGRKNPKSAYKIYVRFSQENDHAALLLSGIPLALFFFVLGVRSKPKMENNPQADFIPIGKYQFHPKSGRLVLDGQTTLLTAKETNVLEIFALRPNEVIAREILQNEVWESKGVIVGRSLDVFISRLRKKLCSDENVRILSLHGTGYKLVTATEPANTAFHAVISRLIPRTKYLPRQTRIS